MTERARAISEFLAAAGWADAERRPLAADASFRRYERLSRDGASRVLMDAPPPRENVRAFERIARTLIALGLSAPRAFEVDEAAGLMLLEDFGDRTFTRALAEDADEATLYRLAIDSLIALHQRWQPGSEATPAYDDARLLEEALLLPDWFLPALRGGPTPEPVRAAYIEAWRAALARARAVPDCLVLRDYHVDNLMLLEGREGVAACGLLDFQDAAIGPVAYDVVSLLEDARRDLGAGLAAAMLARYLDAFPELDRQRFMESYAVLGAQRAAKIVGIFTRLSRRDGKDQYLHHIPRVWRHLTAGLEHPALAPVKAWFDREVPAAERKSPPACPETSA
ncbi:MAG: phosphotransferase [Proteobacteria bacterium]|nr:phosphotransferase [Pseudomonadota bacterium]